jgi:hypothetical protein
MKVSKMKCFLQQIPIAFKEGTTVRNEVEVNHGTQNLTGTIYHLATRFGLAYLWCTRNNYRSDLFSKELQETM